MLDTHNKHYTPINMKSEALKATAQNGDAWTGEVSTEGTSRFWHYLDTEGREYQSGEMPVYRIAMDNAAITPKGIIPLSAEEIEADMWQGWNEIDC